MLDNAIKARFTTAKTLRNNPPVHALPDAYTDTTICGLDTTTGYWHGGMYNTLQEVTCGNCVRILTAAPRLTLEVFAAQITDHLPADHSECAHAHDHDFECAKASEPDSECTCNEHCDSVGGRHMDGDRRYLSETNHSIPFDAERWSDAKRDGHTEEQSLFLYVHSALRAENPDFTYATWQQEGFPAHYNPRAGLVATMAEDDGSEIYTELRLTLTGPGVTEWQRRTIFEALASR